MPPPQPYVLYCRCATYAWVISNVIAKVMKIEGNAKFI